MVGMEESKGFGNEILRSIRGDDLKHDITIDQFHFYWNLISNPCSQTKLHILFHLYDRNMDGIITFCDMKQVNPKDYTK